MKSTIKTAVFPVAGIGSRFLPITKASPKEMLPIIDRPVIQYAVDEAVKAGIQQLIFVTSNTKRSIEDYFDSYFELEFRLSEKKDFAGLNAVKNVLPPGISCVYIRQPYPLGLGDAVLRAKDIVGEEPFAIILADDVIHGPENCLEKMIAKFHEKKESSVLAVEEVSPENVRKYGIVATKADGEITQIIEKPTPERAPSNTAVIGRYILTSHIFKILEATQPGSGGEIQLTDAIAQLIKQEKVYAHAFQGKRYDCGNRVGLIRATIDFALANKEISQEVLEHMIQAISEKS